MASSPIESPLEPHSHGLILRVRTQPGARRNHVGGMHDGALKVALTQVAEKGKANAALIEMLAEALNLSRSKIELVAGGKSRQKRFLIATTNATELERIQKQVAELASGS